MYGTGTDTAKPQFLTVRSSAGSGKTYRLAEHYLKVLLSSALFDRDLETRMANIVAITFTNKAAEEMRLRILDWMKRIILDIPLENASVKPLDAIMAGITALPDEGPPGEDDRAAKVRDFLRTFMERRFSELLKDYSRFNVGTIDSFVNTTLKASAMQLNLPPDFEVSMETRELIDLALGECLQAAGEDPDTQKTFDRFIQSYIELEGDRAKWIPRDVLLSAISNLWDDEARENRQFAEPDTGALSVAKVRRDIALKAEMLLKCLEADSSLKSNHFAVKALKKCADPKEQDAFKSAMFDRCLENCMNKGSGAPCETDILQWEELKAMRPVYARVLAETRYIPYLAVYSLFKTVFEREVVQLRRTIPIDQLNRLLQSIVTRQDFVPEIYYTLSERYIHFLIDEFQDTSLLQWKNIEVLADEALSRGGTLFLVGDRKQAIYRWRGGRPDLIDTIAGHYEALYPAGRLDLDTNYRSGENIVAFNNAVFSEKNLLHLAELILAGHPAGSAESVVAPYRDSRQNVLPSKQGRGYVEIGQIVVEDEDGGTVDTFTGDEANELIERRLKELIKEILGRGVYREKDIAILARTRQEARTVVSILLSMDLNVESEYTVSIRNNPIVREVMSFLKFVDRPDDSLSFASFITGSIFSERSGIDAGEMGRWLSRRYFTRRPDLVYLDFRKDFKTLYDENFEVFLTRAGYLPLYDLLVEFLKHWEVLANFPGEAPYLLHLLELAKEWEAAENGNLGGFLDFAAEDKQGPRNSSDDDKPFLLATNDALNAIKVLTIHKAKGLQFPVVILPYVSLGPMGSSSKRDVQRYVENGEEGLKLLYLRKDYVEMSEELAARYRDKEREYLADELNNLYVAFTRAEEELYILLTGRKRSDNRLITYLFAMDDLAPYRDGMRITGGAKKAAEAGPEEPVGAAEVLRVPFADFAGASRWPIKIRRGITSADALTERSIAARRKGDAVHRALSLVEWLPVEDDFLSSIARAAAAMEDAVEEVPDVESALKRFFTNPAFRRFFEASAGLTFYNEKEIVDGSGSTFKMDRIIVGPDAVEVIDYKTGESRTEAHAGQVRHYGGLLSEIYPDKTVRMFLLYTDEGDVVEVTDKKPGVGKP